MSEDKTWIVVLNDGETWTDMDGCCAYLVPKDKLEELADDTEAIADYPGVDIKAPKDAPAAFASMESFSLRGADLYEFALRKINDNESVLEDIGKKELWRDTFLRILDLVGGTAVADIRFPYKEDMRGASAPTVIEAAAKLTDEVVKEILKREKNG